MLFQLPGDCEVCRLVAKCSDFLGSDFLVVFTYFCFDASGVRGTAGMVSGLDFVEAASWLRLRPTVGNGPGVQRAGEMCCCRRGPCRCQVDPGGQR